MQRFAWLVSTFVALGGCSRCDSPAAPPPRPPPDASEVSHDGDEQARFNEERRPDLIIKALGLGAGSVIADIGAGSGLLTVHLAKAVAPGGKVVATDIENAVLDLLRSRVERAGLGELVEPRLVAPDEPGLDAGAFDVVLLAEVDHYISDPAAWLTAAKGSLRPRGAIAITNRIHHRARALAAAQAAGLHLVSESTPVPSTYLAIFRPAAPPAPAPAKP